MKMVVATLLFLLLGFQFFSSTHSKEECIAFIRSVDYPTQYWHAYHQTLPILSDSSKTLWSIKKEQESIGFEVNSTSDTKAIQKHLCVNKAQLIRLCDPEGSDVVISEFKLVNQNGNIFEIETMQTAGVSAQKLQVQHYSAVDQYRFELVPSSSIVGTKWLAEIHKGCFGFLREHITTSIPTEQPTTTTARTTITSTTPPSTSTQSTTVSTTPATTPTKPTTITTITTTIPTTTMTPITTSTTTPTTTKPTLITTTATSKTTTTTEPTTPTTSTTTSKKKNFVCIEGSSQKNSSFCFLTPNSTDEAKEIVLKRLQIVSSAVDKINNVSYTNQSSSTAKQVAQISLEFAVDVENIGMSIAENLQENDSIHVKTSQIEMFASQQRLPFEFPEQDGNTTETTFIRIKSNDGIDDFVPVVGILHETLHENLKSTIKIKNQNFTEDEFLVNSHLISASVGNLVSNIKVEITLKHLKNHDDGRRSICAFWEQESGAWNVTGCTKIHTFGGFTKCSCNHLTNFALLTAVTSFKVPPIHNKILSTLSLVCCWISVCFLLIGIVLFSLVFQGDKKHTRHVIHVNLMIALCISQIIFIFGMEATENRKGCQAIAYLLHFFLMSSFTWMLVEGLYLYYAIIKVFSDGTIYLSWYVVLAWGVPAIVVGITGALRHDWYGTPDYCWLSTEGHAIWGFLGPVVAIILVNTFVLVVIIRQIVILSKSTGIGDDIKTGLRSSLILLPILGVTWIFGFLSINSDTIVFQYIFAVTNSLQGFLVTLFHVFLNSEVRNSIRRRMLVWKHTTSLGKAFYGSRKMTRYDTASSSVSNTTVSRKRSQAMLMT